MHTPQDIKFMREAINLAALGQGRTTPDPMVGCVIVKGGKVVSSGYHAEAATPHAEAWAIKKAQEKARGATLYVNLEPCCFFEEKNNPPCTRAIIKAGIKKVVAAMVDPNPSVSGKGIQELRDAGIEVVVGMLEEEAKKLNEFFMKYITTARPFVILKSAMSLDGKIAAHTGESFWVTGLEARQAGHHLRNMVDGVMVGITTVIKDNPHLNVRGIEGKIKNPKKIILDPTAKIPLNGKILANEPENAIIVVGPRASASKIKKIKATKAAVLKIKIKKGAFDMDNLMIELGKLKITSILIEGGGNTNALALFSGIVDKLYFYVAPKIIGGKQALTPVEGSGVMRLSEAIKLKEFHCEKTGEDILLSAYIIK